MQRIGDGRTAILMAVFQGAPYLQEMIESLLAQTCGEFVVFFHDDGSTDGSVAILRAYAKQDPEKFRILEGAPLGSAKANFFWMLSQVEADHYMFADQDDVWLPEKVEKTVAFYRKTAQEAPKAARDFACVFTDMYVADETLEVRSDSMIRAIGRDIERTAAGQILMDNPAAARGRFKD